MTSHPKTKYGLLLPRYEFLQSKLESGNCRLAERLEFLELKEERGESVEYEQFITIRSQYT